MCARVKIEYLLSHRARPLDLCNDLVDQMYGKLGNHPESSDMIEVNRI